MSLKKIKIQIPSIKRIFSCSVVGIILGTLCTYPQGMEIFVGTLCTSFILLINIISWIIVIGKIIATVRYEAILYSEELQSEIQNDVITEQSKEEKDIEQIENSLPEDQVLYEDENDYQMNSYKPNTGGATLFFMLKIPLLFLLLMLCAVVFSPLCIIFSNTIIVLSLLSSTIRVIWKA